MARITHISNRRRRYSPRASTAEKELAYQLWVYECGRNAGAVARRLNVSVERVANWAKRDDWSTRADDELARVMPAIVQQTAVNLRLAAYTASRRLNAILSDEAKPIPHREVDALVKAAAIGGFSAVGKSPLPPLPATLPDRGGQEEELSRIIDAHHKRLGLVPADEQDEDG
jgi:hypothetical protein